MNCTIEELAANFAKLEDVEALVLAGSAATGLADEWSDYDLYANTRGMVPIEFRAELLKPRAARLELHNTFWEWSDEWVESDGSVFDLMYRSCDAIEVDVEAKLGRGVAHLVTPPVFATRFCKRRRCLIAVDGSKLSRTASNRTRILTHS
jgi:predicted nucleotidyltransferase